MALPRLVSGRDPGDDRAMRPALAVALSLLAGCYCSHELDPPLDAGRPPRDAGPLVDAPPDAGPPRRDVGPRADAMPLPCGEPDVAPDERPSDDPSAATWVDPPPATTGPCCDVGELVRVDDPARQPVSPAVAWDGTEWGVAWWDARVPDDGSDQRVVFRRIDATMTPTLGVTPVAVRFTPYPQQMVFANGCFGVAASAGGTTYTGLVLTDRDGTLLRQRMILGGAAGLSIARFPLVHGWAVVASTTGSGGGGRTPGQLLVYDEALEVLAAHDVGMLADAGSSESATVAAARSALVVVTPPTRDGAVVRTFRGAGIELSERTEIEHVGMYLDAVAHRDHIAIAGRDATGLESRGPVRIAIWDPFDLRLVVPPREIARGAGAEHARIAADDVGGTLGVCYTSGASPPWQTTFALLGPDAEPIGAPVPIASGVDTNRCAVASAGRDRYVVLVVRSWSPEGPAAIFATRVDVRR